MSDYPNFSDIFVNNTDYDGKPMTKEQLEELNNNTDFIHNYLMSLFYC